MKKTTPQHCNPSKNRRLFSKFTLLLTGICALCLCGCAPEKNYEAKIESIGSKLSEDKTTNYWKVPMANAEPADKSVLFDKMFDNFTKEIKELETEIKKNGITMSTLAADNTPELKTKYKDLLDEIMNTVDKKKAASKNSGVVQEMSLWEKYTTAEGYLLFGGVKVGGAAVIGGETSITIFIAAHPWVKIGIDRKTKKQTSKSLQSDSSLLVSRNLSFGVGAGGGVPLYLGMGVIWGPMQSAKDFGTAGISTSASFTFPAAAGGMLKLGQALRSPPLFYGLAGISTGSGAGFNGTTGFDSFIDLPSFFKTYNDLYKQGKDAITK